MSRLPSAPRAARPAAVRFLLLASSGAAAASEGVACLRSALYAVGEPGAASAAQQPSQTSRKGKRPAAAAAAAAAAAGSDAALVDALASGLRARPAACVAFLEAIRRSVTSRRTLTDASAPPSPGAGDDIEPASDGEDDGGWGGGGGGGGSGGRRGSGRGSQQAPPPPPLRVVDVWALLLLRGGLGGEEEGRGGGGGGGGGGGRFGAAAASPAALSPPQQRAAAEALLRLAWANGRLSQPLLSSALASGGGCGGGDALFRPILAAASSLLTGGVLPKAAASPGAPPKKAAVSAARGAPPPGLGPIPSPPPPSAFAPHARSPSALGSALYRLAFGGTVGPRSGGGGGGAGGDAERRAEVLAALLAHAASSPAGGGGNDDGGGGGGSGSGGGDAEASAALATLHDISRSACVSGGVPGRWGGGQTSGADALLEHEAFLCGLLPGCDRLRDAPLRSLFGALAEMAAASLRARAAASAAATAARRPAAAAASPAPTPAPSTQRRGSKADEAEGDGMNELHIALRKFLGGGGGGSGAKRAGAVGAAAYALRLGCAPGEAGSRLAVQAVASAVKELQGCARDEGVLLRELASRIDAMADAAASLTAADAPSVVTTTAAGGGDGAGAAGAAVAAAAAAAPSQLLSRARPFLRWLLAAVVAAPNPDEPHPPALVRHSFESAFFEDFSEAGADAGAAAAPAHDPLAATSAPPPPLPGPLWFDLGSDSSFAVRISLAAHATSSSVPHRSHLLHHTAAPHDRRPPPGCEAHRLVASFRLYAAIERALSDGSASLNSIDGLLSAPLRMPQELAASHGAPGAGAAAADDEGCDGDGGGGDGDGAEPPHRLAPAAAASRPWSPLRPLPRASVAAVALALVWHRELVGAFGEPPSLRAASAPASPDSDRPILLRLRGAAAMEGLLEATLRAKPHLVSLLPQLGGAGAGSGLAASAWVGGGGGGGGGGGVKGGGKGKKGGGGKKGKAKAANKPQPPKNGKAAAAKAAPRKRKRAAGDGDGDGDGDGAAEAEAEEEEEVDEGSASAPHDEDDDEAAAAVDAAGGDNDDATPPGAPPRRGGAAGPPGWWRPAALPPLPPRALWALLIPDSEASSLLPCAKPLPPCAASLPGAAMLLSELAASLPLALAPPQAARHRGAPGRGRPAAVGSGTGGTGGHCVDDECSARIRSMLPRLLLAARRHADTALDVLLITSLPPPPKGVAGGGGGGGDDGSADGGGGGDDSRATAAPLPGLPSLPAPPDEHWSLSSAVSCAEAPARRVIAACSAIAAAILGAPGIATPPARPVLDALLHAFGSVTAPPETGAGLVQASFVQYRTALPQLANFFTRAAAAPRADAGWGPSWDHIRLLGCVASASASLAASSSPPASAGVKRGSTDAAATAAAAKRTSLPPACVATARRSVGSAAAAALARPDLWRRLVRAPGAASSPADADAAAAPHAPRPPPAPRPSNAGLSSTLKLLLSSSSNREAVLARMCCDDIPAAAALPKACEAETPTAPGCPALSRRTLPLWYRAAWAEAVAQAGEWGRTAAALGARATAEAGGGASFDGDAAARRAALKTLDSFGKNIKVLVGIFKPPPPAEGDKEEATVDGASKPAAPKAAKAKAKAKAKKGGAPPSAHLAGGGPCGGEWVLVSVAISRGGALIDKINASLASKTGGGALLALCLDGSGGASSAAASQGALKSVQKAMRELGVLCAEAKEHAPPACGARKAVKGCRRACERFVLVAKKAISKAGLVAEFGALIHRNMAGEVMDSELRGGGKRKRGEEEEVEEGDGAEGGRAAQEEAGAGSDDGDEEEEEEDEDEEAGAAGRKARKELAQAKAKAKAARAASATHVLQPQAQPKQPQQKAQQKPPPPPPQPVKAPHIPPKAPPPKPPPAAHAAKKAMLAAKEAAAAASDDEEGDDVDEDGEADGKAEDEEEEEEDDDDEPPVPTVPSSARRREAEKARAAAAAFVDNEASDDDDAEEASDSDGDEEDE